MERTYTTPLLDKLGVQPGARVAIIAIEDVDIRPLLASRTTDVTEGLPLPNTDLILLGAETRAELSSLATLRAKLRPAGAVWVVSLKGREATIRDFDVMAAARAAGLVDNKVASFSDTHTALRLVIPVADRRGPASGTIAP